MLLTLKTGEVNGRTLENNRMPIRPRHIRWQKLRQCRASMLFRRHLLWSRAQSRRVMFSDESCFRRRRLHLKTPRTTLQRQLCAPEGRLKCYDLGRHHLDRETELGVIHSRPGRTRLCRPVSKTGSLQVKDRQYSWTTILSHLLLG